MIKKIKSLVFIAPFFIFLLTTFLVACGTKDANQDKNIADKKGPKPTLVTVIEVKNQAIELTEEAVGTLEGLTNPTLSSEVSARVLKIHVNTGEAVKQGQLIATLDATDFGLQRNEAQAEVARIEAQLANQTKTVARNQALVDKKFISQNAVDNDIAQQIVLKEQLAGAKARISTINHSSGKTKLYAPASGNIEKKLVDDGEYVRAGDPIVLIVSKQRLRAHLPFPEHIGALFKPGLKVRLTTPVSDTPVEAVIHELKPMITEDSRTIDVIADIFDVQGWQPGASVNGIVVLGTKPAAMIVPEQSVVLRPAGEVVYAIQNSGTNSTIAYQHLVKTGERKAGMVEILSGLEAGVEIVVDGAGFLTDKAQVKIATQ